jgi:hypothetical protein
MKGDSLLLLILLFVFSPLIARSDGSISFEGISKLVLSQDPRIRNLLVESLDIEPTGSATRIGKHLPHGGCRVGPYSFSARQAGSQGDYGLRLTIYTNTLFTDANGRPDGSQGASHMIISLQGISLVPGSGDSSILVENRETVNSLPNTYLPNPPIPVPTDTGCYLSVDALESLSLYSGDGWMVAIGNDGSYTGCSIRRQCLHIDRYDWHSRGSFIWSNGDYTYSMTPIENGGKYRLRVRDPRSSIILNQTMLPID